MDKKNLQRFTVLVIGILGYHEDQCITFIKCQFQVSANLDRTIRQGNIGVYSDGNYHPADINRSIHQMERNTYV